MRDSHQQLKPGSAEWKARRAQILTDESQQPLRWFYLSFVNENGFAGAAIVEAKGMAHAIEKAHALGINPGGEVAGCEVPQDALIPEQAKNRLLSLNELKDIFGAVSQPFKEPEQR